jgi:predicted secreted protein
MGDFGRMVYEFQALKEGQTALVIPIKRPWEKESQTYLKVTISVRP